MSKKYWSLNNSLFDSLPKYNKNRLIELFELAISNNIAIKDELIFQLLAICAIIVRKRLYKNPSLQRSLDDLLGLLILRTCSWVDAIYKHTMDATPTPEYYWQLIKNEIHDFNTNDNNPNVSGNWLRKQYQKGKPSPVRLKLKDDLLQINPTELLEFEDILLNLAETERERETIILRFQNYTDYEIAEHLKVDRSTISLIRKELEDRYNQLYTNGRDITI
jgi:hypothetical protein